MPGAPCTAFVRGHERLHLPTGPITSWLDLRGRESGARTAQCAVPAWRCVSLHAEQRGPCPTGRLRLWCRLVRDFAASRVCPHTLPATTGEGWATRRREAIPPFGRMAFPGRPRRGSGRAGPTNTVRASKPARYVGPEAPGRETPRGGAATKSSLANTAKHRGAQSEPRQGRRPSVVSLKYASRVTWLQGPKGPRFHPTARDFARLKGKAAATRPRAPPQGLLEKCHELPRHHTRRTSKQTCPLRSEGGPERPLRGAGSARQRNTSPPLRKKRAWAKRRAGRSLI